jgi:lantibiotic biosynthesis protein
VARVLVSWRPVLGHELARTVRGVLRHVAADIDRRPVARKRPADTALFWAYAAAVFDDRASSAALDAATVAVAAELESCTFPWTGLHGGLCGSAFAWAHVVDGAAAELDPIDELLIARLADTTVTNYDLITGLAGIAVYLLERLAVNPRVGTGLAHVVRALEHSAIVDGATTTWFTPPHALRGWQAERAPEGYFNCGVAHGVPGLIAVLARIATTRGVPAATAASARTLATGGLGWLTARLFARREWARCPAWLYPCLTRVEPGRNAWCYGEPGIAVAAWNAARRLGESTVPWQELARDSARRACDAFAIRDPGLCHGALGIAHLFLRCFQASGETVYADAVDRWVWRALAMQAPGTGIGGFTSIQQELPTSPETRVTSQDLLDGASGIGLALAALLATEEPRWDRMLACDLPPA